MHAGQGWVPRQQAQALSLGLQFDCFYLSFSLSLSLFLSFLLN